MPEIIGLRFKTCGKVYDFETNDIEVSEGDFVVVDSELGLNIGSVMRGRHTVEAPSRELKKIIRKATEDDIRQSHENGRLETEAKDFCLERIMARGLPMKLINTEITLDRKRFIFYFTAERRIDFRELVKDLAARFRTRIEMRQIGVRDEAKLIGGMGVCGRELCCRTFLTAFAPVSIKMAKKQELVLNTEKLSGVCGRLMCCLGYEYDRIPFVDNSVPDEDTLAISESVEVFEPVVAAEEPPEVTDKPPAEEKGPREQRRKKFFRHGRRRKKRPNKTNEP
jgi:cell fate regulator YaaT (PSP1 superfamily)